MTPETGAGWYPRLSPTGEIACGDVTIFRGRPGAWVPLGPGGHPWWLGADTIVYNRPFPKPHDHLGQSIIASSLGSTVVDSGGYNEISAAVNGRWNGYRPVGIVGMYEDGRVLGNLTDIALPRLSSLGNHTAYTDRPQDTVKTLIVDNVPVYTGGVTGYSVGDTAVCWSVGFGVVKGLRYGTGTIEDWSVVSWEDPMIVDTPDGPWVFSNTQTGFILRPAGSTVGYLHTGDVFHPDCKFINGQFVIVSSTSQGVLQIQTIDPLTARVPLDRVSGAPIVDINRPLWFGFYEFTGPTDCPVNCRLKVESVMIVRDLNGRPLYRYVAGDPDGDVDAIDRAVATARAVGDGLAVLAYVPRRASAIRLPNAVVGVECYRRAGESLADFESYIRRTVAQCSRAVLIAQCYTSNQNNHADLRSIPPVMARVAREMSNVEGILVFSGSGRPTGFQDHPEVQSDWRQVSSTISAPTHVTPTPVPVPPQVPMNLHPDVIALFRRFLLVFPVPNGEAGSEAHFQAMRFKWIKPFCEQVRHDFPNGMPGVGGEFGWKRASADRPESKESLALKTTNGLGCWDLFTGVGTGNPQADFTPGYHDIGNPPEGPQVFIPVSPINHLKDAAVTPPTPERAKFTGQWIGRSAFNLLERTPEDRDAWLKEFGPGVIHRVMLARTKDAGRDTSWTPEHGLEKLPALLAAMKTHKARIHLTMHCDTKLYKRTKDQVREVTRQVAHIVGQFDTTVVASVQGFNEPVHNTQESFCADDGFNAELQAMFPLKFPYTNGPVTHGGPVGSSTHGTIHGDRSLSPEENAAYAAELTRIYGRPFVDDEPLGVAEVSIPGRRTNDPQYARRLAQAAKDYKLPGATLHDEAGLTAELSKFGLCSETHGRNSAPYLGP